MSTTQSQSQIQSPDLILLLERLNDPDKGVKFSAIQLLTNYIKSNTANNIGFLREHVGVLESVYVHIDASDDEKRGKGAGSDGDENGPTSCKRHLADILSLLKNSLDYRCEGNVIEVKEWGHQYVKEMLKQLIEKNRETARDTQLIEKNRETARMGSTKTPLDQIEKSRETAKTTLEQIEEQCIKYLFDTNSELDAIDYLIEVGREKKIVGYADQHNKKRMVKYVEGLMRYTEQGEDGTRLDEVVLDLFRKFGMVIEELMYYLGTGRIHDAYDLYTEVLARYDDGRDESRDDCNDGRITNCINDRITNTNHTNTNHTTNHANPRINNTTSSTKQANHAALLLQMNFILHNVKIKKYKNEMIIHAQKDFKLKRGAIDSTKVMGILGQSLGSYGIPECEEEDETLPDSPFIGLVHANTHGMSTGSMSSANALLALAMNREEEEEVTIALLRESLEERMSKESLFALFLVESWGKELLPKDILYDALNEREENEDEEKEKEKEKGGEGMSCSALSAFVLATGPGMAASGNEELTQTILNLLGDGNKKINNLIYVLALGILYYERRDCAEAKRLSGGGIDGRDGQTDEGEQSINSRINNADGARADGARADGARASSQTDSARAGSQADGARADGAGSHTDGASVIFSLIEENKNLSVALKKQINVFLLGMMYKGTGDTKIIEEVLTMCFGEQESERVFEEAKEGAREERRDARAKESTNFGESVRGTINSDTSSEDSASLFTGHLEQLALVAISLISMDNPLTVHLASRIINSSLILDNIFIKRVVPLCLGLLYSGTNNKAITDDLIRNMVGCENGILYCKLVGLGLVCSGSNNKEITDIISSLKRCSIKHFANGLISLGRGIYNTNLYWYEKVFNKKGLFGILMMVMGMLDGEESVIFREPWMFLGVVPAFKCNIVSTCRISRDTDGVVSGGRAGAELRYEFVEREVNVGKKIDVTGMKGNPREITGIYKMSTPFTLKWDESGESVGVSEFFENVVVVDE